MNLDKITESHTELEKKSILFPVLVTIAILIGACVEVFPPLLMSPDHTVKPIAEVKPYSGLELAGRDVYIREGCYNCHTQMIRPFKWETDRFDPKKSYGDAPYSKGGEYAYDRPFQWGSKRTGPDLLHESQIQPSAGWHKDHLIDPRKTSPGSVMPAYPWLFEAKVDANEVVKKMEILKNVFSVPYTDADFAKAKSEITANTTEGDAMIAYLLKLGRDTAKPGTAMVGNEVAGK